MTLSDTDLPSSKDPGFGEAGACSLISGPLAITRPGVYVGPVEEPGFPAENMFNNDLFSRFRPSQSLGTIVTISSEDPFPIGLIVVAATNATEPNNFYLAASPDAYSGPVLCHQYSGSAGDYMRVDYGSGLASFTQPSANKIGFSIRAFDSLNPASAGVSGSVIAEVRQSNLKVGPTEIVLQLTQAGEIEAVLTSGATTLTATSPASTYGTTTGGNNDVHDFAVGFDAGTLRVFYQGTQVATATDAGLADLECWPIDFAQCGCDSGSFNIDLSDFNVFPEINQMTPWDDGDTSLPGKTTSANVAPEFRWHIGDGSTSSDGSASATELVHGIDGAYFVAVNANPRQNETGSNASLEVLESLSTPFFNGTAWSLGSGLDLPRQAHEGHFWFDRSGYASGDESKQLMARTVQFLVTNVTEIGFLHIGPAWFTNNLENPVQYQVESNTEMNRLKGGGLDVARDRSSGTVQLNYGGSGEESLSHEDGFRQVLEWIMQRGGVGDRIVALPQIRANDLVDIQRTSVLGVLEDASISTENGDDRVSSRVTVSRLS